MAVTDISTRKNEKAYNAKALNWHVAMGTNFGHMYLEKPAMISQLPDTLLGKTVLCVGVGSGEELAEILKRDPKKVVAIDISKNLLAIARSLFPEVELHKMDMMNLKFPDSTFDLVYSSLAFHYSKDWDVLLAGLHKVLIKGGTLLFSTHNPDYWGTKPFTGKPYINGRGIKVTEHQATLSGGVNVTYYNIGSKTMIDDALIHAGFRLRKTFDPIMQNIDLNRFNKLDISDYEYLKTINAESPLFYVVSSVKI